MQRILAADIGGTNARFACFYRKNDSLLRHSVVWAQSCGLLSTQDVLRAMQAGLETVLRPGDTLVIALAGPVTGLRGKLTNGELRVDIAGVKERYGLRYCLLLNDFLAEAHATLTEAGAEAQCVSGPCRAPKDNGATRAVLGAGTGLGAASLVWFGGSGLSCGWLPVPSEAGHAPFPFVGEQEQDFHGFVSRKLGQPYATAENVLGGQGLALLHSYHSGQELSPAAVGAEALARDTATLCWYSRFLARFCRQWICSTLCLGGLWITGGIAARNPLCVTSRHFLEELVLSVPLGALLQETSVRLVTNRDSGLWGAARAGLELLRRGPEQG